MPSVLQTFPHKETLLYHALARHKPLRRALLLAGVLTGLVLGASGGAWALTYTFTTIDSPGSNDTNATGINEAGQVAGYYDVIADIGPHGFLLTGGSYSTIDPPGS